MAKSTTSHYQHRASTHPKANRILKMVVITLLYGGIGSLGGSLALKASRNISDNKQVLGTTTESITNKFPYETNLKFPNLGAIPIRNAPSITSPQIGSFKATQAISVFKKVDHWVLIVSPSSDQKNEWWINDSFIED